MSGRCKVEGCEQTVSKPGHLLCYHHWKLEKSGQLRHDKTLDTRQEIADSPKTRNGGERFSSTKLGKHFNLSPTRMNLVLAELGWIEKYTKGWTASDRGKQFGTEVREARQSGVPYVVWPQTIQANKILLAAIADVQGS